MCKCCIMYLTFTFLGYHLILFVVTNATASPILRVDSKKLFALHQLFLPVGMHRYKYVVPNVDNNLLSVKQENFFDLRFPCIVSNFVIQGHVGGLLHFSGGECKMSTCICAFG